MVWAGSDIVKWRCLYRIGKAGDDNGDTGIPSCNAGGASNLHIACHRRSTGVLALPLRQWGRFGRVLFGNWVLSAIEDHLMFEGRSPGDIIRRIEP